MTTRPAARPAVAARNAGRPLLGTANHPEYRQSRGGSAGRRLRSARQEPDETPAPGSRGTRVPAPDISTGQGSRAHRIRSDKEQR